MPLVEVESRQLSLTNLDKVLFPGVDFTKAQLIDYYMNVAPWILPELADRPLSIVRYPNGVGKPGFVAKNAPAGRPDWVRTVRLASPNSSMGRDETDYLVVDDLPTLVWLANLAAIELHTPQWRLTTGADRDDAVADRVVFDLDPGAPAGLLECCEVALLLRDLLDGELDAEPMVVQSGGKGLHIYAPVQLSTAEALDFARDGARRLVAARPTLVTGTMRKELRKGKVFLDWSQNNGAKTTITPYSMRATEVPRVAAPVSWDEVAAYRDSGGADNDEESAGRRNKARVRNGITKLRYGPDELLTRLQER